MRFYIKFKLDNDMNELSVKGDSIEQAIENFKKQVKNSNIILISVLSKEDKADLESYKTQRDRKVLHDGRMYSNSSLHKTVARQKNSARTIIG